jgi:flagellar hook-basal body complex protein FliE
MNIEKLSSVLSSPGVSSVQSSSATTKAAAGAAGGVDFGSMLNELASNTVGALKNAESTSIAGVRGQASVQQVVEAVMNAEQSLQTAIAIRDKAVSAYTEISRMAI